MSATKRRPTMKVACEGRAKVEDSHRVRHHVNCMDAAIDRMLLLWRLPATPKDGDATMAEGDGRDWNAWLATNDARAHLATASAALGARVTPLHVAERRKKLESRQERREAVRAAPGIAQRTPEWYEARQGLVTASDVAQALGCAKFGNQRTFFQKKCGAAEEQAAFDGSIPPLKWGVMFEPVAQAIYSAVNEGMRVHEFGLLRHPTIPFVGASPDGITDAGVMLEIKCPWRRRIVEGEVPMQYYYQIQAQLAVCELEECDYFECEFFEVDGPDDPDWAAAEAESGAEHGRGAFLETGGDMKSPEFVYPPGVVGGTAESLSAWLGSLSQQGGDGPPPRRFVPHWWVLRRRCTARVLHDLEFCSDMFARLAQVWQRTLEYRGDRERYLADVGAAIVAPTPTPLPPQAMSPLTAYAFLDDE